MTASTDKHVGDGQSRNFAGCGPHKRDEPVSASIGEAFLRQIAARRHEAEDTASGAGIRQVAEYHRGNRRSGRPPIPRTPERRQRHDSVRLHQGCKRNR